MTKIKKLKWPRTSSAKLFFLAFSLGIISPSVAEELTTLDGIYTESRTGLDRKGQEIQFFPYDYAVLELQGEQFKYWHFSDRIGTRKFPITGKFTRNRENIQLQNDKLIANQHINEKDYVATTIKGVTGIWPIKDLQDWKNGKHPTSAPILVRVANAPSGEKLDQKGFQYPSVTPLLNIEVAKKYWLEEQKKHDLRYQDLPDPLRTLLRKRSSRNDPNLDTYSTLINAQHQQVDPKLINQLMAQTGKGISIVVGPMILKDIYGYGHFSSKEPAFTKTAATKKAALQTLTTAFSEAKTSHALNGALHIFIRTTGLNKIDLTCTNGVRVKLTWSEKQSSMNSYTFSETVRTECQDWATEQLNILYPVKK